MNDVVIETASARYQDAIDRFVRGGDVERAVLRKAWEDHTVANSLGVQAEELIQTVRAVNASLDANRTIRVIAGDPPIDWDNVTDPQESRRWIELRDSYPADLIRRQVLDRGRRALVVYGQNHLQRRQIVINYDMSMWQAQTVVSLLERDHASANFQHLDAVGPQRRNPGRRRGVAGSEHGTAARNDVGGERLRAVQPGIGRREPLRREGRPVGAAAQR